MTEMLRPMLELAVLIPGTLLAYLPMKEHLKIKMGALTAIWLSTLLMLCIVGGLFCYSFEIKTISLILPAFMLMSVAYCATLRTSILKSANIALAVCGVYACLASITRAIDSIVYPKNIEPWFGLTGGIVFNTFCWIFVMLAFYPASHAVCDLIDDENIAHTWYVFWILPAVFIAINIFIIPWNPNILHTGRIMQGYIVICCTMLGLLLLFYALFYIMAKSLNNNHKLTQENTILYMQQEQYNTLNKAIEETRHARHDMRHHLSILNSFVKRKDWADLENYLSKMSKSIPSSELKLCENNAIDGVAGHYYHRYKDLEIPCVFKLELPKELSVSEIDICLVLSNLLENALEASMRTAPDKRRITVFARMHSDNVVLIKVENFYNGVVKEKNGIFESSKHSGEGIGTQSVRRIAEKDGGYCRFTHKDSIFTADVMLRGNSK